MRKRRKGQELLEQAGVGIYWGMEEDKECHVCIMLLHSIFIIEYLYGYGLGNRTYFFSKEIFYQLRDSLASAHGRAAGGGAVRAFDG